MHTSILVPLDGSAVGNRALPFAVSIAKRSFSNLHIAHVFRHGGPMPGAPAHNLLLGTELESLTRTVIRAQTAIIPPGSARSVTTAFLEGHVARALAEYARANSIDLIVMATRGHGEGHRPLLGSITNELIQRITTPILLAPPQPEQCTDSDKLEFRRILIVLDGQESSEAAIDRAAAFADPESTRFTLLASVAPTLSHGLIGSSRRVNRRETKHAASAARTYLERLSGELRAHGFLTDVTVRVTDAPDMGILELLEVERFDLIALPVDGADHALQRMLGVTLLERVVRRTQSNILVCNTGAELSDTSAGAGELACSASHHKARATSWEGSK